MPVLAHQVSYHLIVLHYEEIGFRNRYSHRSTNTVPYRTVIYLTVLYCTVLYTTRTSRLQLSGMEVVHDMISYHIILSPKGFIAYLSQHTPNVSDIMADGCLGFY